MFVKQIETRRVAAGSYITEFTSFLKGPLLVRASQNFHFKSKKLATGLKATNAAPFLGGDRNQIREKPACFPLACNIGRCAIPKPSIGRAISLEYLIDRKLADQQFRLLVPFKTPVRLRRMPNVEFLKALWKSDTAGSCIVSSGRKSCGGLAAHGSLPLPN